MKTLDEHRGKVWSAEMSFDQCLDSKVFVMVLHSQWAGSLMSRVPVVVVELL